MGSSQSAPSTNKNIRLECFLNSHPSHDSSRKRRNDLVLKGTPVGETLRGVVRLQVPRRVRSLEKYEGIVLTLVGQEVWMLDGRPLRMRSTSQRSLTWNSQHGHQEQQQQKQQQQHPLVDPMALRHVQVEKMITDFEFTQVGDGIDFRFPFGVEVPAMPAKGDDDDEAGIAPGMAFSSRSQSSSMSDLSPPTKQIVYKLRASLKRKSSSSTRSSEDGEVPTSFQMETSSSPAHQAVVCSH